MLPRLRELQAERENREAMRALIYKVEREEDKPPLWMKALVGLGIAVAWTLWFLELAR